MSCGHWVKIAVTIVFLMQCAHLAFALGVKISWMRNQEDDIAGYKVYYGTASRDYQHAIDVGPYTSVAIDGLHEGTTYYLAVTAYDRSGNESAYSQEVRAVAPGPDAEETRSRGGGNCFISLVSTVR
jgi:fibronectin type 3 domain-containing protein